jgi:hypothetical protein
LRASLGAAEFNGLLTWADLDLLVSPAIARPLEYKLKIVRLA